MRVRGLHLQNNRPRKSAREFVAIVSTKRTQRGGLAQQAAYYYGLSTNVLYLI